MRRLVALVLIAASVVAAVFLADHPGRVEIVWQGWLVDTSVAVAFAIASHALAIALHIVLGLCCAWFEGIGVRRLTRLAEATD